MNINFELYRIFYEVANHKNITKAANYLNISQPAISKSIKKLEEQLGGTLFIRTKKGVSLTNEGNEFYKYIKQAMENILSAENKFSQLKSLETGSIKIGISVTLTIEFLLPYIKEFHKLYPNINIQIITNITSELFKKLYNGTIDMIIFNNNGYENENEFEIINCKKITNCFVVNNGYKDIINKEISLKELCSYPLILQTKESATRDFIDQIFKENNINISPKIELASYQLVVEFAKIGFGIGYVTKDFIKDELKNNELYELKIKEKIPTRNISIAISKNYQPNFSTKRLIEIIKK